MKVYKKGKFIYFENPNKLELARLRQWLSITQGYGRKTFTTYLIWKERKQSNTYYTYQGYEEFLKKKWKEAFKYDLEIEDLTDKTILDIDDIREKVSKVGNLTLRPYQLYAVITALQKKYGAVQVATGGGKSLIMSAILKYLDLPSLVITPTVQLAQQFYQYLLDLGFPEEEVSLLQGKDKDIRKINIVVINTVHSLIKTTNKLKDIKVVLTDEHQHTQSKTYREVFKYFADKTEYNLGFTGSLFRTKQIESKESIEDFISLGIAGKPIVNIDLKYLMKNGYLSAPVIYIEYGGLVKGIPYISQWNTVLEKAIIKNTERNKKIAEWIKFFFDKEMTTLTLVDRILHIEEIFKQIEDEYIKENTIVLLGNRKGMIYEYGKLINIPIDYNDILNKIRNKEYLNVIGSTVLKEGTDIPAVNTVILGYVGKSLVSVVQKIGRGLRTHKDKSETYIIDFYDDSHKFVENHSKSRVEFYKEQEFPIYTYTKKEEFKERVKKI